MAKAKEESYGYYAPLHHVPAEGVVGTDEVHQGGYMTDRGERIERTGFGKRGRADGSVPVSERKEDD